jgi:magnesium-transporting ATPase (P-type)
VLRASAAVQSLGSCARSSGRGCAGAGACAEATAVSAFIPRTHNHTPNPPTGNVLLVKGAAECVLERCDRVMLPDGRVAKLTPAVRSAVLSCVDDMADNALRILAHAPK